MSGERRLRLVFTGQDQTGNAVKSVSDSLKDLRTAVREGKQDLKAERQAYSDSISVMRERQRQERALGMEFKQNHQNFFRTAEAVNNVGHIALKANSIFQNYNLTQLRLRDIQRDVRDSYRQVQEAIQENGVGSDKARQAIQRYNDTLEEQKRLNAELPFQYLTMGLATASFAGDIGRTVKQLATWRKESQLIKSASKGGLSATDAIIGGTGLLGAGGLLKGKLGGAGKLGALGGVASKAGLYGAVAVGGLALGGFLGQQGLKAVYGEKEGDAKFKGIMGQLGLGDFVKGEDLGGGVTTDNSMSIGQVIIYTNSVQSAEDLKRQLQAEAMRTSEG